MPYKNIEDKHTAERRWHAAHQVANTIATKKYHVKILTWFRDYKSKLKCFSCPETHPACLDFHHRDARSKELSIADAMHNHWSITRLLKEIEKCDVMCSNCHRKLHSRV